MNLKTAYQSLFKVGAAVSANDMAVSANRALIAEQFSSMTCENDMKPMYILSWDNNLKHPAEYNLAPAVTFEHIRTYLEFARDNKIPMRGHTLVWHNQTPDWFFHENYDMEAPLASRETMLARMESYIRSVLTFVQTEYPGVIYAWDVTNEIVDEGDFRKSLWLKTVGQDFFIKAFEYARKYAEPDILLFYNDYDASAPWKRDFICENVLKPLMKRNLVDGMGMQSHLQMNFPDWNTYADAVEMYGAMGLVIHMTELDIHNNDPSEESMDALATRYGQLFSLLAQLKRTGKANIECVTFWCLLDEESWLTGFRREASYPLLFHGACEPKKAYYAVLEAAGTK